MSTRVLKRLYGKPDFIFDFDTEEDASSGDEKDAYSNDFKYLRPQTSSESEAEDENNEFEDASADQSVNGASKREKRKKRRAKKNGKKTKYASKRKYRKDKNANMSVADSKNQLREESPPRSVEKSLLSVELKYLHPRYEMLGVYGKRLIKIPNKRGGPKLTWRTTHMVIPMGWWPPVIKSITMSRVKPPEREGITPSDKRQWYAFEHSHYYQSLQYLFLRAVEHSDINFFSALLNQCEYHVDCLIQMSEYYKMNEDYCTAVSFIEQCILVLESSLHPSFSLTSGNCCLDYYRQENRPFFIVLFKHAQYLENRACCRTAFELAKFILSLDPEGDPLQIVLVIDYYALRCRQYSWVVEFYEANGYVTHLPNWAYSNALALFCILGECAKSDLALQYALLMNPGVLLPLLDGLSIRPSRRLQSSNYFKDYDSLALRLLINLYICRATIVWDQHNISDWLERNIQAVLDHIDKSDNMLFDFRAIRKMRYESFPSRSELRHVILSDFKEKVPVAMFLGREIILMHDPLPPVDSVNSYTRILSPHSFTTKARRTSLLFLEYLLSFHQVNNRREEQQHQQTDSNTTEDIDIDSTEYIDEDDEDARGDGHETDSNTTEDIDIDSTEYIDEDDEDAQGNGHEIEIVEADEGPLPEQIMLLENPAAISVNIGNEIAHDDKPLEEPKLNVRDDGGDAAPIEKVDIIEAEESLQEQNMLLENDAAFSVNIGNEIAQNQEPQPEPKLNSKNYVEDAVPNEEDKTAEAERPLQEPNVLLENDAALSVNIGNEIAQDYEPQVEQNLNLRDDVENAAPNEAEIVDAEESLQEPNVLLENIGDEITQDDEPHPEPKLDLRDDVEDAAPNEEVEIVYAEESIQEPIVLLENIGDEITQDDEPHVEQTLNLRDVEDAVLNEEDKTAKAERLQQEQNMLLGYVAALSFNIGDEIAQEYEPHPEFKLNLRDDVEDAVPIEGVEIVKAEGTLQQQYLLVEIGTVLSVNRYVEIAQGDGPQLEPQKNSKNDADGAAPNENVEIAHLDGPLKNVEEIGVSADGAASYHEMNQ